MNAYRGTLNMKEPGHKAPYPHMAVRVAVGVVVDGVRLGCLLGHLVNKVLRPVGDGLDSPLPVVPLVVGVLEIVPAQDHEGFSVLCLVYSVQCLEIGTNHGSRSHVLNVWCLRIRVQG